MIMYDWRVPVASEPHVDARPWRVEITEGSESSLRIEATCPDGTKREVWIEIQDGRLVIHAYDPEHEEPVNLRISKTGITLDSDRADLFLKHYDPKCLEAMDGFTWQMASMSLPEEEYQAEGYPNVEEYVSDLGDERLCGEYDTFMDMIRAARAIRG